jgi:glycosyltransferase involved in cell wall biosynthesis
MSPRVSVIMTTYNPPKYLRQAIQSVRGQSYTDWELLIISDASPHPETKKIIAEFTDPRIQFFENSVNVGNARAANSGIRKARGEFIARIDDDDAWVSTEKLVKQIAFLDANPDHILVGGNIIVADFDTDAELYRTNYPTTDEAIRNVFFFGSPFAHSSILFRRELAMGVGLYDETLRRIEDYDLWMRLGHWGKLANLSDHLIRWRAPSHIHKNVARIRYNDHMVKIRVLWRHRKNYPHFLPAILLDLVKVVPYFILSFCNHRH